MRRHPMHQYIRMQELQKMRERQKEEERLRRQQEDELQQGGLEEDLPMEEPEMELATEKQPGSAGFQEQEAGEAASEPAQPRSDDCGERVQDILREERLRAAAEMENFKKRLNREYQEQLRFAAEKVLSDLLPTLDNMDLALQYGSQNEACKDMLQGVAMTRKLLEEAVGRHGLSRVGQAGEDFDPAVHEAVGFDQNPDYDSGKVARVLQSGYKLNDRLLRPAKVMVNQ